MRDDPELTLERASRRYDLALGELQTEAGTPDEIEQVLAVADKLCMPPPSCRDSQECAP